MGRDRGSTWRERARGWACTGRPLRCRCRLLVLRRRPALCCRRRPLRLRPLRLPRRRGAPATTPTALPTAARSDQAGGGTGVRQIPTLFLAADLCSRVGPACCFPRPPALLSRARFLPSSRPRAARFPAREPRVFHRLAPFFDRFRAV